MGIIETGVDIVKRVIKIPFEVLDRVRNKINEILGR